MRHTADAVIIDNIPALDSHRDMLDRPLLIHLPSLFMGLVEETCETYTGPDLVPLVLVDDGVRVGV